MDFLHNPQNQDSSDCSLSDCDLYKCPFLRNIDKPTNFSFAPLSLPTPSRATKGPIFEDGPNFNIAFSLFHGKDGVVPLTRNSEPCLLTTEAVPKFDPLAASISMSAFGQGGPFGFHSFFEKMQKRKPETSKKKDNSHKKGESSKHEALGNEWLETGNCPIAKSYRAVGHVIPLVATALQPPAGLKLKCPPAVVAARAALARTAFVKNVRPQPLPSKILVIGVLGIAANIPLGVWREHTKKFSLSWFTAVHAAVPFIAMLRKSVVMPKTAMALTIAGSILGQIIGSRAERLRLKAKTEKTRMVAAKVVGPETVKPNGMIGVGHCGEQGIVWDPLSDKAKSSPASVCC